MIMTNKKIKCIKKKNLSIIENIFQQREIIDLINIVI